MRDDDAIRRYANASATVTRLTVAQAAGDPDVRARIDALDPAAVRDALEAAVDVLAYVALRDAAQPEDTDAR